MFTQSTKFFSAMMSSDITFTFCALLFAIFFMALILTRFNSSFAKEFTAHAQASLTTIGVLGTFFGIYVGLLDFDVKDIDASIPPLLDGLKLAFVTSILGMALSIIYRALAGLIQPEDVKEASSDEFLGVLRGVRADIQKSSDTSVQLLTDLKTAIIGESDEDTLLTSTTDSLGDLESTEQLDQLGQNLAARATQNGLTLNLIGGLAVRLSCRRILRDVPTLERPIRNVNFVGYSKDRSRIEKLMQDAGLNADREFNMANGQERIMFLSQGRGADSRIEVFLDKLKMNHEIPFADRLDPESLTVSPTDLILSKLQIVDLARKDALDLFSIAATFDFLPEPKDLETPIVNTRYISQLCAEDWGFYCTITRNLRRLNEENFSSIPRRFTPKFREHIATLLQEIDSVPKGFKWKARSIVGTRVRWYDIPKAA
ncbi:hypothetical protein ACFLQ0_03250 [Nitrospinota bacterium]